MELRNLITFVRIAEVKNFSKSAQLLGYSQSAVTMQIKQLEQELGRQLFERIGKQAKLTQAGERLLPYALDILNTAQKAQSMVRENEQITGHLRIGTCESYVIGVLPQVLTAFQQQCPNVEVQVQTGLTTDLFHRLRQNDIDLLFFLTENCIFRNGSKCLNDRNIVFLLRPQNQNWQMKRIFLPNDCCKSRCF